MEGAMSSGVIGAYWVVLGLIRAQVQIKKNKKASFKLPF